MAVEFYQDVQGDWRWRLYADNGEIVASGEAHESERDAQRAFERAVEIGSLSLVDMQEGDEEGEQDS